MYLSSNLNYSIVRVNFWGGSYAYWSSLSSLETPKINNKIPLENIPDFIKSKAEKRNTENVKITPSEPFLLKADACFVLISTYLSSSPTTLWRFTNFSYYAFAANVPGKYKQHNVRFSITESIKPKKVEIFTKLQKIVDESRVWDIPSLGSCILALRSPKIRLTVLQMVRIVYKKRGVSAASLWKVPIKIINWERIFKH